jgi:hypothetical protein
MEKREDLKRWWAGKLGFVGNGRHHIIAGNRANTGAPGNKKPN